MKKNTFNIATDSSCDFSKQYYDQLGVHVIPMSYTIDSMDYTDSLQDEGQTKFFDQMRNGSEPKTVQVSVESYFDLWETLYLDGPILQICLSSGMSGTASTAVVACEMFCEKHKEAKILVVDSLGASINQGLLVKLATHERDREQTIEQTKQTLDTAKLHSQVWFTVDDLEYLKRGGRVSSASAFFGTLLSIKPVLTVNSEGKIVAYDKLKGRKKALKKLFELYCSTSTQNDYIKDIYIAHSSCLGDAEILKEMLLEHNPALQINISQAGPIIGSHTGPGLVVISFFGIPR